MKNIFNIKRFGLVFRKDMMENMKRYTLLFLTLIGIMAIVSISKTWNYCYNFGYSDRFDSLIHNRSLLTFMSLTFLAGGLLFSSTFMAPMNSKLRRLSFLSTPASNFEKFFSRWLIVTIGYLFAFFVAMWIAEAFRVAIVGAKFPDLEIKFIDLTRLYYPTGDWSGNYMVPKFVFTILIGAYFLFQSYFLLGATFFEKTSFVKTFVALSVIICVYGALCAGAINLFYEEGFEGFGCVMDSFLGFKTDQKDHIAKVWAHIIPAIVTIGNWLLAYRRFCESEVIKKL